jgi:hypothetical protein
MPPPTQAAQEFQELVTSQTAVQSSLSSWLTAIASAKAAAQAIDTMRAPASNPFVILQTKLDAVNASTQLIQNTSIHNLTSTIDNFNKLWWSNGTAAAFQNLIDRALYANRTVMALSHDVLDKVSMCNASLAQINQLFQGSNNLLYLPANITAMVGNLTQAPDDLNSLKSSLQTAQSQLSNAGNDIADIIGRLDNLTVLVGTTFKQLVQQVNTSIVQYQMDNLWAPFNSTMQPLSVAVHQVVTQLTASSSMGPFIATARSLTSTMDQFGPDLAKQAASISSAKAAVNQFNFAAFSSSLDAVAAVYASFGGNPAQASPAHCSGHTHTASLTCGRLPWDKPK